MSIRQAIIYSSNMMSFFNKTSKQVVIFEQKLSVRNVHEKGIMEIIPESHATVSKNIKDFVDRAPLKVFEENNKLYILVY